MRLQLVPAALIARIQGVAEKDTTPPFSNALGRSEEAPGGTWLIVSHIANVGDHLLLQAGFNVQPAGSDARLLANSDSKSDKLTMLLNDRNVE